MSIMTTVNYENVFLAITSRRNQITNDYGNILHRFSIVLFRTAPVIFLCLIWNDDVINTDGFPNILFMWKFLFSVYSTLKQPTNERKKTRPETEIPVVFFCAHQGKRTGIK